ncbi:TPA: hypothetical protein ACNHD8_005224, partial [Klebsiella pneumoniae]
TQQKFDLFNKAQVHLKPSNRLIYKIKTLYQDRLLIYWMILSAMPYHESGFIIIGVRIWH